MRHVANKLKMTLAALVSACMLLTGVPAVAFAAAGEAASDAVGSLGDAIGSLAADAGEDPAITPLADEEPDYSVTTVVFELTDASYLKPQLFFQHAEAGVTIDWGDGSSSTAQTASECFEGIIKPEPYASTGTYTVRISSSSSYCLGTDEQTPFAGWYRSYVISVVTASNAKPWMYSFSECSNLSAVDLSHCDTSNIVDMSHMFSNCSSLTSLDLSSFDTSKVRSMEWMFYGCSKLTELDVSGFDTSQVGDMELMFGNCESLTRLYLSNFDTAKVTDIGSLFYGCSSLVYPDISNFDTSAVTDFDAMFYDCTSLEILDLSNFDTTKATNMNNMFHGCSALMSIDLTSFKTSSAYASGMFSGCTKLRKLALGSAYSFYSSGQLPSTLDLEYESTGNWVDIDTGTVYSYNRIPDNKEAIYYAQATTTPLELEQSKFEIADTAGYTGSEIVPSITTDYLEGTEYVVSYDSAGNYKIGDSATLTITGVGNYAVDETSEYTNTFTATVTLEKATPAVKTPTGLHAVTGMTLSVVELPEGWTWDDPEASVGEIGINYFSATYTPDDTEHYITVTRTLSLRVTTNILDESMFEVDTADETYTGSPITKEISASESMEEGVDYTVAFQDNINAGTVSIIITGIGNYVGSVDYTFTIDPCPLSKSMFDVDESSVTYTGNPFYKDVVVQDGYDLIEGVDYGVTYGDNVNCSPGGYVYIEGSGNYSGKLTYTFTINRRTLSEDDFIVDTSTNTYTGAAIADRVTPTGSLVEEQDYTVTYADNTEVGTATITIAYAGSNCRGTLTYHFTITSNYLTTSSFKVDTSNAAYTGYAITKKIKPSDSLVEGRDYVVVYSNNVDIGTATINIIGINNCFGTAIYTFKIVKPAAKLHAQTIKLAKKKVSVKHGKKAKVKVKGAKTSLVAKPKGKAKKALKVKVKGKKKLIVRAKPAAKRGTYKVKVYAKQAGSYSKSKTVKLKVKVK